MAEPKLVTQNSGSQITSVWLRKFRKFFFKQFLYNAKQHRSVSENFCHFCFDNSKKNEPLETEVKFDMQMQQK